MRTVTNNLEEMAEEIQKLLEDLLLNHSSVYMWNTPGGSVLFISVEGDYAFRDLDETGRQLQSKAIEDYRRFYALLSVLLKDQPKDALQCMSENHTQLTRIIEQEHTWCKTAQEAYAKAVESLQAVLNLLKHLYDSSGGIAVYVPDTNALLINPAIETWAFEQTSRFTLVLVPAVLAELDALKINHRNEAVRRKAEKLIRQIKEYRRRGNLIEGRMSHR